MKKKKRKTILKIYLVMRHPQPASPKKKSLFIFSLIFLPVTEISFFPSLSNLNFCSFARAVRLGPQIHSMQIN